ncbi:protein argonaute-3 [Lutzomyia longipalpis]|uniref:protein argonaute-3 n=1 Tax=Lutzomyia longipalpis TaxID=7200 RepID=UPI002483B62D|nr:protein argonaute-3 [Lutzomyia longipalpis]
MSGRGWQMELLRNMGRSAATTEVSGEKSTESGIQSGEQGDQTRGQSDGSKEQKTSKDSGEESLNSSSQGRGRKMQMALERHLSTQLISKQDAPETTAETPRGQGRGDMLRRAMEASLSVARQYHKDKAPSSVEEVTKKMDTVALLEQAKTTEPQEPVLYRGTKGVTVTALSNYLPLEWMSDKRIYEYSVYFEPLVDSIHLRVKIIGQLQAEIGSVFVFSGFNVYLPRKLDPVKVMHTKLAATQDTIKVTMKLIKVKPEEELAPFLNNLFNKIMRELKFVRHKRKQFDPTKAKIVPQHKLEIWPGYVTAVDTFEGGLMLNLDVSHRRLSTMTIHEFMTDIYQRYKADFHKKVKEALIGKIVLTRYNNETYRIDEVDFTLNPRGKFKRGEEEISYVEYYRRNYNITIRDLEQPLLLSFKQVRVSGSEKKQERITCLIPELCYMTGLTDEQMNNTNLKRDLAPYVTVSPHHRVDGLRKFLANVRECAAARKVLEDWGLELAPDVINLESRELGVQQVSFNEYTAKAGIQADFSRDATSKHVLTTIPFNTWAIVYVERNKNEAITFMNHVQRNAPQLGMTMKNPQHVVLRSDTNQEFIKQINQVITSTPGLSIVVTIFPTQRGDLYAAVKKVCCYQNPVPSQVIMARTLGQSNESKVRSIVMKILLQMNCKVGGTLWSINIPMGGTMICGVDAYHDPAQRSASVTGFVASSNSTFTRWYSTAIIQNIREEVSRSLGLAIKEALIAYRQGNGCLPERIVIFRDGIGDGQLPLCENFEVPQLIEAAKSLYPANGEPKLTYVVTQKRINTRFFRQSGGKIDNPAPGTVVDHSVTRRYMMDFFLISQNVRQGTVTPSHYIVVYDSANLKPDVVQQLAYKLTFMYYNWPGTIRVPACCQYAHKLAYLVGEHVKKEPAKELQDKLFYL